MAEYLYTIDHLMPTAEQSKTAGMTAVEENLAGAFRPFDLSNPLQIAALREELGPAALLPEDDGVHYLMWVETDERDENGERKRLALIIPEGCVVWVSLGLGASDAISSAQKFCTRRGVLPLNDPIDGPPLGEDEDLDDEHGDESGD